MIYDVELVLDKICNEWIRQLIIRIVIYLHQEHCIISNIQIK